MKIPIRLEIKSETNSVRFTITVEFDHTPRSGDYISFSYPQWDVPAIGIIQYMYHHVGEKAISMACCQMVMRDADLVVALFDRFKDSTTVTAVDTDGAAPPPYYKPYRTLVKLWGDRVFRPGVQYPMALAELIRAMWLAGGGDPDQGKFLAEQTHKMIVETKWHRPLNSKDDPIELMYFMKQFGAKYWPVLTQADPVSATTVARSIFSSIRSVPVDGQPDCLKDGVPEKPTGEKPAEGTCDVQRG